MSNTTAKPKLLPHPEVEARPRRRTFAGEYKARALAECDAAEEPGAIGAILSREALYSSHLVDWRRRRADGGVARLWITRCAPGVDYLGRPVTRVLRDQRHADQFAAPRRHEVVAADGGAE